MYPHFQGLSRQPGVFPAEYPRKRRNAWPPPLDVHRTHRESLSLNTRSPASLDALLFALGFQLIGSFGSAQVARKMPAPGRTGVPPASLRACAACEADASSHSEHAAGPSRWQQPPCRARKATLEPPAVKPPTRHLESTPTLVVLFANKITFGCRGKAPSLPSSGRGQCPAYAVGRRMA